MGTFEGRFEDKVAVVTGSSSGIGEETARRLAAEGARVVVNSARSVEAGQAVVRGIEDAGGVATYVQGDISDREQRAHLVDEAVAAYGRLDVLVNNAGVTEVIPHHDLEAVTEDIFRRIYEVNVLGTFELTKLALPHLKASGSGAVVNVSSIAGVRQVGSSIPYAVSKAALNHLTELMAAVVGPEVRINAVAPGLIKTPWTEDWGPMHEAMESMAPLQRSGEPEDVAAVILDLAAAPWLTGQILVIDGGFTLRH
jgi:ketoreductase RED2